MDAANLVETLAQLGLLGAVLIGGGAVFFIMRRDRKNGDRAGQPLIDMFVDNQERIATSQERMVVSFERMMEGQKAIQHSLTELVELLHHAPRSVGKDGG